MAQPMQEGSAFMATKTSHVETAPSYGPSQSYVISFPTSSMVDVGEGLLFLAGWDGMNGVWSQIMPVLGYPSLDLYTAVAEKTPTST
jgi:hypothetical protein